MDVAVTAFVYVFFGVLALFDVGAFYFTYRIMKTVGAFRGWIIFLVFVVAFAAQGTIAFGASVALAIFNPTLMDKYLSTTTVSGLLRTGLYNLLLAGLLFAAMFDLYRVFRKVSKS